MNIGIIGTGDVADRWHAPAIKEAGYTLWSVMSRTIDGAQAFADKHGAEKPGQQSYNTIEDFLSDPQLDAVIIASPDHTHLEYAVATAQAGKHMLIEKPIGRINDDFSTLVNLVEENNVVAGVGYHHRFHAGHQLIRKKILEERTSEHDGRTIETNFVKSITLKWGYDFSANPGWRNDPQKSEFWSLNALGVHMIDLSLWLTGESKESLKDIKLYSQNKNFGANDENSWLKYDLGTVRVSISTDAIQRVKPQVYVDGGSYGCTYSLHSTLGPRGQGLVNMVELCIDWDGSVCHSIDHPVEYTPINPYAAQLCALHDEINGTKTDLATLDDALWNLQVMRQAKEVQQWR